MSAIENNSHLAKIESTSGKPPEKGLQLSSTAYLHLASIASASCSLAKMQYKNRLDIIKQALFVYKNYTKLSKEKATLSFKGLSLEKSVKKIYDLTTVAILPFSIAKGIDSLEDTNSTSDLRLFPDSLEAPLQTGFQILTVLTVLKGYYSVKDSFKKTREAQDSSSFYKQATLTTAEATKHLVKIASQLFPSTKGLLQIFQHISLIVLGGIRFTDEVNCQQTLKALQNLSLDQISTSAPVEMMDASRNTSEEEAPETGAVTKI